MHNSPRNIASLQVAEWMFLVLPLCAQQVFFVVESRKSFYLVQRSRKAKTEGGNTSNIYSAPCSASARRVAWFSFAVAECMAYRGRGAQPAISATSQAMMEPGGLW